MLRHLVLLAVSFAFLLAPGSASAAISPLSEFGEYGDGAGQFEPNADVAVDAGGRAYVAESNNRVDVFGANGAFLFGFGQDVGALGADYCDAGTGCGPGLGNGTAGSIDSPSAIAIGPEGNVFVAAYSYNRISVFEPEGGGFLYAFGHSANPANPFEPDKCDAESTCRDEIVNSTVSGAMYGPTGLAFDATGNLLVADSINQRVDVFSAAGAFLYAIGNEVNIEDGGDECTHASGCDIGDGSELGGSIRPSGVAVDPSGNVVISEASASRVTVLDPDGDFAFLFGKEVNEGTGDDDLCTVASSCRDGELSIEAGGLWNPNGIEVAGDGTIYVVDPFANRVSVFDGQGGFVEAFGGGVIDGDPEFQICTKASGCQTGSGEYPGALPEPSGAAIDCRGSLYVVEESTDLARVGRFGEPGTATPPCPVTPAEEGGGEKPPISCAAASAQCGFPIRPRRRPSLRLGKVKLNVRKGTATLTATVSGPGKLVLTGKSVKKATKQAKRRGKVTLSITPTAKTKKTLDESQKARDQVSVAFRSAVGGPAVKKTKTLTLKLAPR